MPSLPTPAVTSSFSAVRRPKIAAQIRTGYGDVLATWPQAPRQLPIVYSPNYNVTFFGIEKMHAFDSTKFGKVVEALELKGCLDTSQLVSPLEAPVQALLDVHTSEYIMKIHTSRLLVAQVTEMSPFVNLPNSLLQWRVITPLKYHVAGTMAAAALAMEHGWAINMGGGMHHSHTNAGMGWCPFNDIYLAIRRLRFASDGAMQKVLYIDLDAHQGNGVARDKLLRRDNDLFILDVYNENIFPSDDDAKAGINIGVGLRSGVSGPEYLSKLGLALEQAAAEFQPDLVFYNAGTDVLEGDGLGRMAVDEAAVLQRDEMVWRFALEEVQAPIVMVLSGGYAERSAEVITDSLTNLMTKFDLNGVEKASAAAEEEGADAAPMAAKELGPNGAAGALSGGAPGTVVALLQPANIDVSAAS